VNHDELFDDDGERKQWHDTYRRLSDAVGMALRKFMEVVEAVQRRAHATGKDIHVVTQLLVYDFAEPIDGVTVLVRSGSAKNCPQLLRTAYEIGLELRYILEDDDNYERRSLAYEYYHLLDGLKWVQRYDPDHPAGKQLQRELEGDVHAELFDSEGEGIDYKQAAREQEERLNSRRYEHVRAEITRMREARKKARREGGPCGESPGKWFSLWGGPKDVRALAMWLKELSGYETLYRVWSNTTHGEGALKRIMGWADDGRLNVHPLRSPVGLPQVCVEACLLTFLLARTLVEKLVPELTEDLRDWYTTQLKPALDFLRGVKINC
jgi:hypothetical protein